MVKKHRILGLTFDERRNWKEHIKYVKAKGDKKAYSTKKLIPQIMGLGPENTLADSPNDSFLNRQIWRGGLRINLMRGPETTGCSLP
jgi:hypothetical protein